LSCIGPSFLVRNSFLPRVCLMHKAQEGKLTFRRLVFFCMGIWVCSARPGQFEYYRNYDDLEVSFWVFISLVMCHPLDFHR
jgi:hypothetical protein